MTSPWSAILEPLELSRAEQAAVKRFEQDPEGRNFLPVADILKNHRKIDEAIELLSEGVAKHPSFTVARVILARELLSKGLVMESHLTLDGSPTPLNDNVLAQKLSFRLANLLGNEERSKQIYQQIVKQKISDDEIELIGEKLNNFGVAESRKVIIKEYENADIKLVIPKASASRPAGEEPNPSEEHLDEEFEAPESTSVDFQIVPLNEIFKGDHNPLPNQKKVELDSTTIAELYCKQGHFGKALKVYRRLAKLSPHNEYLRRRIREVSKLESEQRSEDLSVDPGMVDQMESVEIIDHQRDFFNEMLSRLDKTRP